MKAKRKTGEMDSIIGENIRFLRQARGITQQQLAGNIGVSYQQLQKYETGVNRVSAAMLIKIADFLGSPPATFLNRAAEGTQKPDRPPVTLSKEILELIGIYSNIKSKQTRQTVKRVLLSLAELDSGNAETET